jgi:hypothetical protein
MECGRDARRRWKNTAAGFEDGLGRRVAGMEHGGVGIVRNQ